MEQEQAQAQREQAAERGLPEVSAQGRVEAQEQAQAQRGQAAERELPEV